MTHVVHTERLLREGVIDAAQAAEIARRSRETMVALAVNSVLCVGIVAATLGLIFWLGSAAAVAVAGAMFLAAGGTVLWKGGEIYRMLGNASALIGAGMLIGGAGVEAVRLYGEGADVFLMIAGAVVAGGAFLVFRRGPATLRFASGSTLLLGGAMHLVGVGFAMSGASGLEAAAVNGYAFVLLLAAGVLLDVRLVTALAIVPFAQMLDTGTDYFHAMYVFYSPESTLTILQMMALMAVCIVVMRRGRERLARHAGILAILAAVVGNLAFLVGSLWGDQVGASLALNGPTWTEGMEWSDYQTQVEAWEAQFLHISENVFSLAWAALLAVGAFWAAHANRRGLFNAAITFGAIHGYTQVFETMGDEPMAWALGGLALIPLAWGMWRLNRFLSERKEPGPALAA